MFFKVGVGVFVAISHKKMRQVQIFNQGLGNVVWQNELAGPTCNKYGIQYILSTLDEDIQIADDKSEDVYPKRMEIVLELHDDGDNGRLFKVERF